MTPTRSRSMPRTLLAAGLFAALAPAAVAQTVSTSDAWCSEVQSSRSWGQSYCEVRTFQLGQEDGYTLRAGTNGGVKVIAWDRSDAQLRVRVVGHAPTSEEARRLADGVAISTGATIRSEAPDNNGRNRWAEASFELYVPRTTDLDLRASNGGIDIKGVAGAIRFATSNGGVKLDGVNGDVEGHTTNGGVDVRLSGGGWQGEGLDVRTTNGGVRVAVPEDYDADLNVRTTNGRFDLGFPVMVQGRYGNHLETRLGRGGAPVRITTTNGGVVLRRPS